MSQPDWIQYGVPTLDRPFGLALWPIFSKAFESLRGYSPEAFRFVPGKTPMATMAETALFLISRLERLLPGRVHRRGRYCDGVRVSRVGRALFCLELLSGTCNTTLGIILIH